jgi:hypothetical protein
MTAYRFDFRRDGTTLYHAVHEFRDDLDALEAAEKLESEFEVNIWCGERLVARVKPHNEPSTGADEMAG